MVSKMTGDRRQHLTKASVVLVLVLLSRVGESLLEVVI
jgi:hypothetical protein